MKERTEGHVVEDFIIKGTNTHVLICDDYCRDKTEADARKTMEKLAEIVLRGYRAQQLQGSD